MNGEVTVIIRKSAERKGGYGFIRDEHGHDRFFHARDLIGVTFDELQERTKVTFEPLEVPFDPLGPGTRGNGRRAEKVIPA